MIHLSLPGVLRVIPLACAGFAAAASGIGWSGTVGTVLALLSGWVVLCVGLSGTPVGWYISLFPPSAASNDAKEFLVRLPPCCCQYDMLVVSVQSQRIASRHVKRSFGISFSKSCRVSVGTAMLFDKSKALGK